MKIQKLSKKAICAFFQKPAAQIFALSVVLQLLVDSFSRESLFSAFGAMFTHPLIFLYNVLIIAITLAPALFFAHRYAFYITVSLLWVIIGVTDFILLQFRTTPFTFVDITMIRSAINIWNHYLTTWQLVLIAVLLIGVIIGCVFLFRKIKKTDKLPFLRMASILLIMIAGSIVATDVGVRFHILARNFGNIADAYHTYGLPYCFMSGIFNTGISKPKKYSDEYVQQLMDAIENGTLVNSADITVAPAPTGQPEPTSAVAPGDIPGSTDTPDKNPETTPTEEPQPPTEIPVRTHSDTPNILFLQLESFFDPTSIVGAEFDKDPMPNYRRLLNEYTSGYLSVPSVGAGTANTEFEVITGMNLDFFGPGEYPYKTILTDTTSESIAYVLKELGYGTHAIHNNDGTFYGRHTVFPNLGFDSFTPIEYMNHIERTPLDWAKDYVLIEEIAKALSSTEEPDFIYTISVQGHGSYPSEAILTDPEITLTLSDEYPEELYYQLLYYSNQIYEMDAFVADLIEYLESTGEDTVLVMYGDHLPGFKLTEEQLTSGSLFYTQYIMWSNFDMEAEHRDMEAYQLYSYVLDRLNIHSGILNGFHQTQMGSDTYLEDLEILEYDMLYGDYNAYADNQPYPAVEMQMGIDPIEVTGIRLFADSSQTSFSPSAEEEDSEDDGGFHLLFGNKDKKETTYTAFLTGTGFTTYSVVLLNDEPLSTMQLSDTVLSAIMPVPEEGDLITVVQQGVDGQILSTSAPLEITGQLLANIFPEGNPTLEGED